MATYEGRKIVNIVQAAEMAGVSRRSIYHWMKGGKIEYIHTAGGSVRIFADTLFRSAKGKGMPKDQSLKVATG